MRLTTQWMAGRLISIIAGLRVTNEICSPLLQLPCSLRTVWRAMPTQATRDLTWSCPVRVRLIAPIRKDLLREGVGTEGPSAVGDDRMTNGLRRARHERRDLSGIT